MPGRVAFFLQLNVGMKRRLLDAGWVGRRKEGRRGKSSRKDLERGVCLQTLADCQYKQRVKR